VEIITSGSALQITPLEALEGEALAAWVHKPEMLACVRRRITAFHDARAQLLWGRSPEGYRRLLHILIGAAGEGASERSLFA